MSKISLHNILGKNKEFVPVLAELMQHLPSPVFVEDDKGKLLFGELQADAPAAHAITYENNTLGIVKGHEPSAGSMAKLISQIIQKEGEKKKLGSEVLSLYHEINVIFNFSEQLAQTIDPESISRITLQQAMESIACEAGVLVLWDEETKTLQIPAHAGQDLFDYEVLRHHPTLLLKIGMEGQSEILADLDELKAKHIVSDTVQSLVYAAMKVKHRIMGAIILTSTSPDHFSAGHLKLLVTLALQSSAAIESAMLYERNIREVREREEAILRIHEVTQRFVPHEFIRSLGKETLTEVRLGDQAEKIVTVLFTDIRDYTTLSEKLTPEENFEFVCAFNARLGPIIRHNHGFVNQYQGDSIMAIFPYSPEDALKAAIAMQKAVHEMSMQRIAEGLPPITTGIGMHTGPLIMGITGDEKRMDATTISDTVNTAARIESLTKYYKCPLLLSEETFIRIEEQQQYHTRHLGSVRLKGKRKLLNIMECMDGFEGELFDRRSSNLSLFHQAMQLYNQQQFETAIEHFMEIMDNDPDDMTTAFFLNNARHYLREGVPDNWSGIHEMTAK